MLVVDDNATSRALLAERVSGWGLRCTQAAGAEEALSRYAEATGHDDYDLVLVDCDMPGVDGVALTRTVRDHDAAAGRRLVPVVMLMASQRQRPAARLAGVDGFVSKPVRLAQLEVRVRGPCTSVATTLRAVCGPPGSTSRGPAPGPRRPRRRLR